MKLYKYGIEICDAHLGNEHSTWICDLTNIMLIDISFCFNISYSSMYYDGNHYRLQLGIFEIYWFM